MQKAEHNNQLSESNWGPAMQLSDNHILCRTMPRHATPRHTNIYMYMLQKLPSLEQRLGPPIDSLCQRVQHAITPVAVGRGPWHVIHALIAAHSLDPPTYQLSHWGPPMDPSTHPVYPPARPAPKRSTHGGPNPPLMVTCKPPPTHQPILTPLPLPTSPTSYSACARCFCATILRNAPTHPTILLQQPYPLHPSARPPIHAVNYTPTCLWTQTTPAHPTHFIPCLCSQGQLANLILHALPQPTTSSESCGRDPLQSHQSIPAVHRPTHLAQCMCVLLLCQYIMCCQPTRLRPSQPTHPPTHPQPLTSYSACARCFCAVTSSLPYSCSPPQP